MRKHRTKKRSRRRRFEKQRHVEIALANGMTLVQVREVVCQFKESVARTRAVVINNMLTTLGRAAAPYESPYDL